MSATLWSKFFWSDWQADEALRACSLAARGLWMEMLCIAVHNGGYLARGDKPLTTQALAKVVGHPVGTVEKLIAELEQNHVFSRDRRTRIYSRRLVREQKRIANAIKAGKKGGQASRDNKRGIFAGSGVPLETSLDASPAPRVQKPESKSQEPKSRSHEPETLSSSAAKTASPQAPLIRVAELMGVTLDQLHKRTSWMVFGDTFATWVEQGCDPERDIWPTIAALAAKRRKLPNSPLYFRDAVFDARDQRLGAATPAGRPDLAPGASAQPAKWVSPEEWQTRLDVFKTINAWSHRWGPRPDEPGCLAPDLAPKAETETVPETTTEPTPASETVSQTAP